MPTDLPCPAYVEHKGEKRYCEVGKKGHWGTHYGWKHESDYRAQVRAAKESQRATR